MRGYKLKGFLYGIILLVTFTLILAPMIFSSLNEVGLRCGYFCAVGTLLRYYQNPLSILFFLVNWFLGVKIAKLSYLLSSSGNVSTRRKGYTWLWEHKLRTVED